jgi:hypothetical protein
MSLNFFDIHGDEKTKYWISIRSLSLYYTRIWLLVYRANYKHVF